MSRPPGTAKGCASPATGTRRAARRRCFPPINLGKLGREFLPDMSVEPRPRRWPFAAARGFGLDRRRRITTWQRESGACPWPGGATMRDGGTA